MSHQTISSQFFAHSLRSILAATAGLLPLVISGAPARAIVPDYLPCDDSVAPVSCLSDTLSQIIPPAVTPQNSQGILILSEEILAPTPLEDEPTIPPAQQRNAAQTETEDEDHLPPPLQQTVAQARTGGEEHLPPAAEDTEIDTQELLPPAIQSVIAQTRTDGGGPIIPPPSQSELMVNQGEDEEEETLPTALNPAQDTIFVLVDA